MEDNITQGLINALNQNSEVALVTIIQITGSTPQKVGAKMLVWPDGTIQGTIGGGCGEAEARREALHVINSKQSKKYCLNMNASIAEDEGMVCGGRMDLFIDYYNFEQDSEHAKIIRQYLSFLQDSANPIIATLVFSQDGKNVGKKRCVNQHGESIGDLGEKHLNQIMLQDIKFSNKYIPILLNFDSLGSLLEGTEELPTYQLFIDPPQKVVKLVILGGGHIALPLATMAKILGYEVTVVDDRYSFANTQRFFMADRVLCEDFEQALAKLKITPEVYVVIVTRGHRHDKICLKQVVKKPTGYIGMIGSKRRVQALKAILIEEGITEESLEKVYAPIGLKIGAETPEEIALCILGEIIMVNKELKRTI